MAGLKRGRKKKPRPISPVNSQTNLFVDDEREVARIIDATGKSRAEVVRDLVSTGIRTQRLRAVGKDEAMSDVIDAQKSVVSASFAPLTAALTAHKEFVERSMGQMQAEYASIEERLARIENAEAFQIRVSDRILQNLVLIRAILWHYVFYFYYSLRAGVGRNLTQEQLQQNYQEVMQEVRTEAAKERMLCDEKVFEGAVARTAKSIISKAENPSDARQPGSR